MTHLNNKQHDTPIGSQQAKYRLTDETVRHFGSLVYRIEALIDFDDVKAGDKGGFVESEANLSHEGNCWIYDDAVAAANSRVYEDAKLHDNAVIDDFAKISGKAQAFEGVRIVESAEVSGEAKLYNGCWVGGFSKVSDNAELCGKCAVLEYAKVSGHAKISENAKVSGEAEVTDNAQISGNAEVTGRARASGNARVKSNSYVTHEAEIYGDAFLTDHAYVTDKSRVGGESQIKGRASIRDYAEISGDVVVLDSSSIKGSAKVSGGYVRGGATIAGDGNIESDADYVCFSNVGPENGTLTVYTTSIETADGPELECTYHFFRGSPKEFLNHIKNTYSSDAFDEFAALIRAAEIRVTRGDLYHAKDQ